ncbi:MAG TPA: hypothetical protein VN704_04505 [Verrucomicrobiae bacterium]|nr:hypothetical protein [Verrucomicrobiae bacterium]
MIRTLKNERHEIRISTITFTGTGNDTKTVKTGNLGNGFTPIYL